MLSASGTNFSRNLIVRYMFESKSKQGQRNRFSEFVLCQVSHSLEDWKADFLFINILRGAFIVLCIYFLDPSRLHATFV